MKPRRTQRVGAQAAIMRGPHISELRSDPRERYPLAAWFQERRVRRERMRECGVKLEDPATCACGNTALWKWKDRGFCRSCKPTRLA